MLFFYNFVAQIKFLILKKLLFIKTLSLIVIILLTKNLYGQKRIYNQEEDYKVDLVELKKVDYKDYLPKIESVYDHNKRIRDGVKKMFLFNKESDHLLRSYSSINLIYDEDIESPIIEDFSSDKRGLSSFFDALISANDTLVRVAVIGDSFIEGDIFTQDIRAILQSKLGGNGVGFVSTTSLAAPYRTTVKHTFSGWKTHYLKSQRNFSEDSKQILPAFASTPVSGSAVSSYNFGECQKTVKNIDKVKYFYTTLNSAKISFKINDRVVETLKAEGGNRLQMFEFKQDSTTIGSFRVEVNADANFYSYGVSHESNSGVVVDNFSDRGSSGVNISKISDSLSFDFDSLSGGYSLIVLQYGLNVMYSGNNNYKLYENKIVAVVEQLKRVHPNASIVVMGVSQRKIKKGGVYQMMDEAKSMERHQRAAAERTGLLFWSTQQAMIGSGGIETFSENGWIARDYTHINRIGGSVLAEMFVNSLAHNLKSY